MSEVLDKFFEFCVCLFAICFFIVIVVFSGVSAYRIATNPVYTKNVCVKEEGLGGNTVKRVCTEVLVSKNGMLR